MCLRDNEEIIDMLLYVGLLPGPGAYDDDQDKAVKFDRTPKALLRPKTNIGQPRDVIDFSTLTVNPNKYDFTAKGIYYEMYHFVHR